MNDTAARLEAEWLDGLIHRWGTPMVEVYDQPIQRAFRRTVWIWMPGGVNNGLHLDRYPRGRVEVVLWNHKGDPSHIEVHLRSEPSEEQMDALIALMWGSG